MHKNTFYVRFYDRHSSINLVCDNKASYVNLKESIPDNCLDNSLYMKYFGR